MAGDLNREASELWNSLKPIIDKEIDARTQGVVQRRKAKVTTAPSLVTNTIGVTEPFGTEMFLPFNTNIMSASVGDFVWVEYMYGMTNAFVSMFASADEKDWDVAGDLSVGGNAGIGGNLGVSGSTSLQNTTVNGVLDITPRRCEATLSAAGWYRAIVYNAYDTYSAQGTSGEIVTIKIVYTSQVSVQHEISLWMSYGKVAFLNETSHGTTNLVDKIRYTYAGSVGYVDIHITSSSSVTYNVSFEVASRIYAKGGWVAGTLTSVAASPSGETVLTTYEFTTDGIRTVTLTSAHSSVTINSQKAVRYGKVVSMTVSFTVSTSISGYGYLINTPTFATPANALVYDNSSTVQTNVRLYASEGNTGLRSYGSFPAGSYVAFITYITTDA